MRKYIYLLSLFISCKSSITAQTNRDSLTENIIKNSQYIIEGEKINSQYCNCLSNEYYDQLISIRLTTVLRGDNIKTGDTILILNPKIGYGNKDSGALIDQSESANLSLFRLAHCKGGVGCGGQFLSLNKSPIISDDLKNKKMFILYPSETCSCYLPKDTFADDNSYEIIAFDKMKFQTKKGWYDYLKQFSNINVPNYK